MILYKLAKLLFNILSIPNFIAVMIDCGFSWKTYNKYFESSAIDLDIFANHNYRTLWNKTMRIKGGYKFGIQGETISSALGKNQRDGTLSWFGKFICWVLCKIEKDHCKKSIKEFAFFLLIILIHLILTIKN